MRKILFPAIFGIFLVSMLFVPASMSAVAQDPPYFGAIVDLNKIYYLWTDMVFIAVVAPNFNLDPERWDSIGSTEDSRITITSTNGEQLDFYMLQETGPDTGVFGGAIYLTGFSYDVDGDGKDDPIMFDGKENIITGRTGSLSGSPTAEGSYDGMMRAVPGDIITVTFSNTYCSEYGGNVCTGQTNVHHSTRDVDGDGKDDPATIVFWLAELGWQSDKNKVGEPVTITVVDHDMNLDQYSRDRLYVEVYSDSDFGNYQGRNGYLLPLIETETASPTRTQDRFYDYSKPIYDSGIFEGQIIFTDCSPTDLACLKASGAHVIAKPGDTITVEYTDCTVPQPFFGECLILASEAKAVAGEAKITGSIPPLERFGFGNARVVDEFGVSVPEVTVGQQIQIVADIINLQDKKQSFAYVVQVQDLSGANDESVALEWTEGSLDHLESAFPAVSWTPSAPGSYTVTLAVWVSVDDPSALAPMQRIDIDVFPKTVEPVTAIPEWIKNNAGWWADGQIDDSSFLQGIQFLIKEGIMVIPPTETSGSSGLEGVPAWVKNNAGWWADGQIDDNAFVSGIQYLVKEGIIKVS